MKNIIIVSKGNNAVAVGENMTNINKTAPGAFSSNLEVIKEILKTIPVEPSETVHLYVPDIIQGIVSGSAIEYVKTGKTAKGNDLSAEEVESFKEFYQLYAERILNVRFSQFKYIAKDNAELQELKKKAWDALNAMGTQTITTTTQTLDPDKSLREAIEKQMVIAMEAGDFDKYDMLEARKAKLTLPTVVSVQGTTTNNTVVKTPGFSSDEAYDKADNESEEQGATQTKFEEQTQPSW